MESRDLRVFQMVAREGTITKAALQLGYVQSNVTARIQQLEAELGTTLFLRHNRGMTLSASGKLLLDYANKIIGLLDEASKALSSSAEPSGPLMIGSTQTTAAVRLPKLLASYYEEHPNVQLSLTTGHTQFLLDKVLRYELDGAFIGCECHHPELESYPAFEEEPVVVSAASVPDVEEAITKPFTAQAVRIEKHLKNGCVPSVSHSRSLWNLGRLKQLSAGSQQVLASRCCQERLCRNMKQKDQFDCTRCLKLSAR